MFVNKETTYLLSGNSSFTLCFVIVGADYVCDGANIVMTLC